MSAAVAQSEVVLMRDWPQLRTLVKDYRASGNPVYFDTETTGLDPRAGYLVMLQFMQDDQPAMILDLRRAYSEDYMGFTAKYLGAVSQVLAPLFDGTCLIVGMNLKFDLGWIGHHLRIQAKRVYDVKLAEQVIMGLGGSDASSLGVSFTLRDIAKRRLDIDMSKEERSWFIDLHMRDDWSKPFPEAQLRYGADDIRVLGPIMAAQTERLTKRGLLDVAKLEMRALPAISAMEQAGVLIDVDGWRAVIAEKADEADRIGEEALSVFGPAILLARAKAFDEVMASYEPAMKSWQAAHDTFVAALREEWESYQGESQPGWGEFKTAALKVWRDGHPRPIKPKADTSLPNLGSTKQLLEAFEVLGIDAPSTGSDVLRPLESRYEPVALLLKWRKATKFVDAFGESLLKHVGPDGRIHPEYQQIGASTGRMSCTRPNWQQVPSKGDGERLRALVKAAPGNRMLTADFSNIELRILADYSGDAHMLDFFRRGVDVHTETAKLMFDLPKDMTKEEASDKDTGPLPGWSYRDIAKTINFGLVYGMSANKLGRALKIDKGRSRELMDAYFDTYPGVVRWLNRQKQFGLDKRWTTTMSGRIRYYKLGPEPLQPPRESGREKYQEWREAKGEWDFQRGRIERQACNTPIQGTSADITKLALALLFEAGVLKYAEIVAVVHDEIVMECAEADVKRTSAWLAKCMRDAAQTYLQRVAVPETKVAVSDHWEK